MKLLNKLDRKIGKYAIRNLMLYIVISNAIVFVFTQVNPIYLSKFILDPRLVMKGEVWRLITFIMIPPTDSPIFVFLILYFYYMVGGTLEHQWGSFKFNAYYFIGMLGTIIAAFILGEPMIGAYINLSLFFAFATLYPDFQVLIFFIIPVKIKYLAYLSWAGVAITIYSAPLNSKIAVIVAIINYLLFFGRDIIKNRKRATKAFYRKKQYTSKMNVAKDNFHKCEVCGRTEEDDGNLEFRYCSKCDGYHEYCSDHLFNHEHIKE